VILAATLGWMMILAPIIWRYFRPTPPRPVALGYLGLVVPWFVVPTAIVLAYSVLVQPMYSGRYFAFTTPAIALLIGASAASLRLPWMRIASVGLLGLLVLPVYISQRGPTAKNGTDWQQAAAIVQAHAKAGEDIYYGIARVHSTVSMHKISEAYPAAFAGLNDITLESSPLQAANLWGENWPLSHAKSVLQTTPLLWAVIEHPGLPSPVSNAQERYIEKQGLHLVHIWRGSETDILEFSRLSRASR
jgi:mannosyltransferase